MDLISNSLLSIIFSAINEEEKMNKLKIVKSFIIIVNLIIIIPTILYNFSNKKNANYFLDLPLPFFLFSVESFPFAVSEGFNCPEISVAAVEI